MSHVVLHLVDMKRRLDTKDSFQHGAFCASSLRLVPRLQHPVRLESVLWVGSCKCCWSSMPKRLTDDMSRRAYLDVGICNVFGPLLRPNQPLHALPFLVCDGAHYLRHPLTMVTLITLKKVRVHVNYNDIFLPGSWWGWVFVCAACGATYCNNWCCQTGARALQPFAEHMTDGRHDKTNACVPFPHLTA